MITDLGQVVALLDILAIRRAAMRRIPGTRDRRGEAISATREGMSLPLRPARLNEHPLQLSQLLAEEAIAFKAALVQGS